MAATAAVRGTPRRSRPRTTSSVPLTPGGRERLIGEELGETERHEGPKRGRGARNASARCQTAPAQT